MTSLQEKVVLKDVTKSFRQTEGDTLKVLDGVTFSAKDNEICCLVGTSGCGKSTILNIIAGLIPPDLGEVHIRMSSDRQNSRIGYVFQRPRLLNWRTVRQNLMFALRARKVPREEWQDHVDSYLQLVGLEQFSNEYPLYLSGGMQQRLSIARALITRPAVLLMDEPFSNLDELTARGLRQELLRIWEKEKTTIIFVTHNAHEAVYLAHRVLVCAPRPTRIMTEADVDIPFQRDFEDPRLFRLQKDIIRLLGLS